MSRKICSAHSNIDQTTQFAIWVKVKHKCTYSLFTLSSWVKSNQKVIKTPIKNKVTFKVCGQ
jgi:hypothetical protein